MKRWLQFLFLLFTASALAHVPEKRHISEVGVAGMRLKTSADFRVCCIAGFQTRGADEVVSAGDLEIGDTWPVEWKRECVPCGLISKYSTGRAGFESCATLAAGAYLLTASYRYDPYRNLLSSSGELDNPNTTYRRYVGP